MQLVVNVTYAIPIGIGLWVIGVPNALLWGLLALVMRFVPFIGPVISSIFPLALAIAVDSGMVDAAVDGCLVRRRGACQQQRHRAMALRLANRAVAVGHHRGRGPVDLALGAARVAASPPR